MADDSKDIEDPDFDRWRAAGSTEPFMTSNGPRFQALVKNCMAATAKTRVGHSGEVDDKETADNATSVEWNSYIIVDSIGDAVDPATLAAAASTNAGRDEDAVHRSFDVDVGKRPFADFADGGASIDKFLVHLLPWGRCGYGVARATNISHDEITRTLLARSSGAFSRDNYFAPVMLRAKNRKEAFSRACYSAKRYPDAMKEELN